MDQAYDQLGRAADFFNRVIPGGDVASLIGGDEGDGRGRALRATVRACSDWRSCPMRNAFWSQGEHAMFLGTGFASGFDVIAHELTHGVTAATSALIYSGESGAMNESLSDVFAELAEQTELGPRTDWLMGEDLHVAGVPSPIRDLRDPTRQLQGPHSGQPDRLHSPLFRTASSCSWDNDFCYVHLNSGVGNKTGYLITAGGAFNGQTVVGIGVAKAARLYWEVERRLSPRAGYLDLGRVLNAACRGLVGSVGFTAADCLNVARATTATEIAPPPAPSLTVRWPARLTGTVVVTGRLLGRPAGTPVVLRRRATILWVTVARATTDSTGAFRLVWSPRTSPRAGTFRVEVAGRPVLLSPTRILVPG